MYIYVCADTSLGGMCVKGERAVWSHMTRLFGCCANLGQRMEVSIKNVKDFIGVNHPLLMVA